MRRLITSPKQAVPRTTLLSLFNAYDCNPNANYTIRIGSGLARGVVEQHEDECQSEYVCGEDYSSFEYEEVSVRRGVGLFGNIIRNMEMRRQQEQVQEVARLPVKEYKEYQFYYPKNVLVNCANQPKKIDNDQFSKLEVVQLDVPPKVEAVQPEAVPSKRRPVRQEKGEMVAQMIDLNFSFDQISQNIQEMRSSRPEEDTIIKRFIKGNEQNEEVKHKTEESLPNKKLHNSNENDKEPSPAEERSSIQINHSSKIVSEKSLQAPSQPLLPSSPHAKYNFAPPQNSLFIQGTKRTESRLFTRQEKAADIRIDFDLDLDFI